MQETPQTKLETFNSLKSGHTSHMKSGNPDPIKPHIKKTKRIKKSLTDSKALKTLGPTLN